MKDEIKMLTTQKINKNNLYISFPFIKVEIELSELMWNDSDMLVNICAII